MCLFNEQTVYNKNIKKVFVNSYENLIFVIDHTLYSPDLSPYDLFLFPSLRTAMKWTFYDDMPAVKAAVA